MLPEVEYIIPEPIVIYRNLGLYAETEPLDGSWTNGDVLRYEVYLSNDGTEVLSGIDVRDDLGLNDSVGSLQPGESITLEREYRIDDYNRDEIITNSIDIAADFEDEHISLHVNFSVDVKIPKGSITIINDSDELEGSNEEFDFIIDGPMGSRYSMSLMPGESGTIEDLFIGDYRVATIAPLYYETSRSRDRVELSLGELDKDLKVECSAITEAWFTSSNTVTVSGDRISSRDVVVEEVRYTSSENRTDSVSIELEPIIIIPEPIIVVPEFVVPVDIQPAEDVPPITEEPITEEPIIEEPITEEPISEEPIIEEPVTEDIAPPKEPEALVPQEDPEVL